MLLLTVVPEKQGDACYCIHTNVSICVVYQQKTIKMVEKIDLPLTSLLQTIAREGGLIKKSIKSLLKYNFDLMSSENVHQVLFLGLFCPEGRQQYGAMCFLLFRVEELTYKKRSRTQHYFYWQRFYELRTNMQFSSRMKKKKKKEKRALCLRKPKVQNPDY